MKWLISRLRGRTSYQLQYSGRRYGKTRALAFELRTQAFLEESKWGNL